MSFITVTLIRHGETEFNHQSLVQGVSDIDLNDTGRQQSQLLGANLAHEKYTRVYSSNLKRAASTCKIILENLKYPAPPMKLDSNLREKDFGEWEGKDCTEMFKAATKGGANYIFHAPKGGETHQDTVDRGMSFVEELFKICDEALEANPENILVVSHGLQLLTIMLHLKSKKDKYALEHFDPAELLRRPTPNTGKTILRIHKLQNATEGIRRVEILCLGDGSHLN